MVQVGKIQAMDLLSFFEENLKEISKRGSSKLEETLWNDVSSLSFAFVKGGLGFFLWLRH